MLTVLIAVFLALQVGDAVTTAEVISRAAGREANPIMSFLFSHFGVVASLVLSKVVICGGLVAGCEILNHKGHGTLATCAVGALSVLGAIVVANNVHVLLKK